ncbi:MAG: glycosyltransferase family 8 protein [bacterium]|nr:glycosyltransferase family 8 protein [bacterium]
MSKINVCLSCDDAYAKYAGVVVASILANAEKEDEHVFYILDGGVSEDTKKEFEKLKEIRDCDINFIKIDEDMFEDYKAVRTHYYITLPTFYRLKIQSLLPDVEKIIYFDCDFVVCTTLKQLWNTDLGDNIAAGVLDKNSKRVKENNTYINAGLIVFDLNKMRKNNIEEEFLNWTKANIEKIKLGDQEIINEVLKGRIKIVEDEWNVQSSNFINRSTYTKHPKAIHLLDKPWKWASACIHKKEYFKYLQLTPWKMDEKEYKHWTFDNEIASWFAYIKRRPLFLFRPGFYAALWAWIFG